MAKSKVRKVLENLDLTIAAIILCALVLLTMMGVVFRYFVNRPFAWLEEIQTSLIIWVVFMAGCAAFRRGEHMCMEFVYDLLPKAGQRVLDVFIYLVTVSAVSYLGVKAVDLIKLYAKTNRATSILQIPAPNIYFIIPVGCALMIISETVYFWNKLHDRQPLSEIELLTKEVDAVEEENK